MLTFPQPEPSKKKRKPGFNSKTVCLTDYDVVEELEANAQEKLIKEQEKNDRRIERDRKKKERAQKKQEMERRKKERERIRALKKKEAEKKKEEKLKKKGQKKKKAPHDEDIIRKLKSLTISSESESEAECPKCGLIYGEDEGMTWICCDRCNTWFDLECAGCYKKDIPDEFVCDINLPWNLLLLYKLTLEFAVTKLISICDVQMCNWDLLLPNVMFKCVY